MRYASNSQRCYLFFKPMHFIIVVNGWQKWGWNHCKMCRSMNERRDTSFWLWEVCKSKTVYDYIIDQNAINLVLIRALMHSNHRFKTSSEMSNLLLANLLVLRCDPETLEHHIKRWHLLLPFLACAVRFCRRQFCGSIMKRERKKNWMCDRNIFQFIPTK